MSKIQTLALPAPLARSAGTLPLQRLRAGLRRWLVRQPDHESLRELGARQRRDAGLDSDAWGRESAEPYWRA
jgi:hypothetical protein